MKGCENIQMDSNNLGQARVSTTLAENTRFLPMRVLVDWVTCSFYLDVTTSEIFHFLGVDDLSTMEEIPGARYEFAGYNMTYKLGVIELMHDDQEGKWLLNMSGQACRQYEISSNIDMVTMFAMLANVHAVYTRLDIAIDDFKGIYSTETIRKATYNKQCVTHLKEWGNGTRGLIKNGNDFLTMDNFYLGSSTSRYRINVYDKKIEREVKDKELPLDENGQPVESWTRTEIRLSYEYAQQFVAHILTDSNELGYHIKSFLNEKVQFVTLAAMKKDSNFSRLLGDKQNICKWWRTFLNGCGRLNLSVYKPDKTLEESKDWLMDKVSTTLAMWHLYKPESYDDLLRNLTVNGLEKMKKKHQRKIDNQVYLDAHINSNDIWISNPVTPVPVEKVGKGGEIEPLVDVFWSQVKEQQKIENKKNLNESIKKGLPTESHN